MKKVEVYFDYTCPYCNQGIGEFFEILERLPEVEVDWIPAEVSPYPEEVPVHTDKAIQVMYSVKEQGGDVKLFQKLMFEDCFEKDLKVDDLDVLTDAAVQCGADKVQVLKDLEDEKFAQQVCDNGMKAWEELELEAVPSYRIGEEILGSAGGVLVDKDELEAFIKEKALS